MQTRTTMRNWAIASAVAAMMAAATSSAFAQVDTGAGPTPTATPPGPTSVTPENSNTTTPSSTTSGTDSTASAPMSASSAPSASDVAAAAVPANFPTDYALLNNKVFDNVDLEQSRARGLSENQIATIVKISKKTGLSYGYVAGAIERGATFPELASTYNLRLSDVYENDKEKQEITDYTTLYQSAATLGKGMSMTAMPMTPSAEPMTPPMTPPTAAPSSTPAAPSSATLDIVDTAMAAKNLTTLVKALQIAGLVETLKGAGPFTVFAPDDKAFSKLPAGALDALEADPAKLKMVLTYHVIPGAIMAKDAAAMTTPTSPPTVEGATLQVTKGRRGKLKVNDATVTKADIEASNGVIHVIDRVLMPPMDASSPAPTDAAPPATPAPTDATPPAAPATPGTTAPAPDTTTPPAAPATPAAPGTPGQ